MCKEFGLGGLPPASVVASQQQSSPPLKTKETESPFKPVTDFGDLHGEVADMLMTLGASLSEDPILFVKLARMATASLKEVKIYSFYKI